MLVALTAVPGACAPSCCSDGAGRGRAARLVERGLARRDPRLPLRCSSARWTRRSLVLLRRAAGQRRLGHALSGPAAGADADRGPRRVLHPGHRAARARRSATPMREVRQVEAILQPLLRRAARRRRIFAIAGTQRPGAPGLRGGAAGRLGRARARPAGDHALADPRARGAARRARLPGQPGGPRPARQPHAAAGRDRRPGLREHQGVERRDPAPRRGEPRPAQRRDRFRAEPAAARRRDRPRQGRRSRASASRPSPGRCRPCSPRARSPPTSIAAANTR